MNMPGSRRIACALLLVPLLAGCKRASVSPKEDLSFVQSAYFMTGSNPAPPVASSLLSSTGRWIKVCGMADRSDRQHAVLSVPFFVTEGTKVIGHTNVTVILAGHREWDRSKAPSHRSLPLVTGFLTQEDGALRLKQAQYEWIDQ